MSRWSALWSPNVRDGPRWRYEIKLDGYRAIAVKSSGQINLFSRRGKSFSEQFTVENAPVPGSSIG